MIARLLTREKLQFAMLAAMRMGISFSQLIIVVVAGTLLDKADFGRFAIIFAGARLLAAFAGLGAPSFLLKDVPWRQAKALPWHSTGAATLTFIVYPALICAAVGGGAEAIGTTGTEYYPLLPGEGAVMALLGFVWAGMLALGAYVRTTRGPTEAMLVADLYTPLAMLAALVMLWTIGLADLIDLVLLCCAIVGATQLAMLTWHAVKGWIPVGGPDAQPVRIRELLAYWGTVLLNTASTQIDILIAGSVVGPVATGVYTIIKRITNILALPMSIAVWMLAPRISRASATDDRAALAAAARSGIRLAFFPALALTFAVAATAPWWFAWFEISLVRESIAVLCILLFANLLSVAFGPSMMFATQTGMPQVAVRALTVAVLVAGGWMTIGGGIGGVIAIAFGQVLMYLLINTPIRRAVLRRFGLEYSILSMFKN
jgi:O-antigen/teichoic acid export membrane protein